MPASSDIETGDDPFYEEDLRDLLPEEINDGDITLHPVALDPSACERLKQFLEEHIGDGERAGQVYVSTLKAALIRHAAADPKPDWKGLRKSIERQAGAARLLLRALEAAEAQAERQPRRLEASLLTRASNFTDVGGRPRYRYTDAETSARAKHDPLEYRAFAPETAALKHATTRRLRVLELALTAIGTRKGRPRGGVLHPLIYRLGGYWKYGVQADPSYWRRPEDWDGPLDLESRTAVTGPFIRYCELALECLPEEKRHGAALLESTVRAICDSWTTIKVDYTDDLYRM